MVGNAGGCVGVKGMLAARKDQEKKEKREKELYHQRLSSKGASSLEKGFPLAPGMMFSLHQEGFEASEASFHGVGVRLMV